MRIVTEVVVLVDAGIIGACSYLEILLETLPQSEFDALEITVERIVYADAQSVTRVRVNDGQEGN